MTTKLYTDSVYFLKRGRVVFDRHEHECLLCAALFSGQKL